MKAFVLGKSLPYTLSLEVHKLFGMSDYGKIETEQSGLEQIFTNKNFEFCNVTVPYKQTVMQFLDEISEEAQSIGAVNTVVNVGGKLIGYNTDIDGIIYAIKRSGINVKDERCLILGTGATSNIASFALHKMGAREVIKVGRTSPINYQNVYDLKDIGVVLNTTPVGTFPNNFSVPVDVTKIKGLKAVFDVVYNPLQTELITRAKALGLKTGNGLAMLVEQARLSENLAYNNKLDVSKTEKVLDTLYKSKRNIALIGMPGSGKTTLGGIIAKELKRPFIDLDEEICKKTGMDIPRIFSNYGEEYFRKIESEALLENSSKLGVVIATGGGAPCFGNNFYVLKQNCFIVYVKRELSSLATDGRPLSKSVGVEEIYKKRRSVYEQADVTAHNEAKIDDLAKEIIKLYEKNTCY